MKVEFISFIRCEKKFKNIDQLKKQIDKDILVSKKELNKKISINEVKSVIQFHFQRIFDAKLKIN